MDATVGFMMVGFGYIPMIVIGLAIDIYGDVRNVIKDRKAGKSVGLSLLTYSITSLFLLGVLGVMSPSFI